MNGSRDIRQAAEVFQPYWLVVLGDGLQDPRHPDHAPTRELVQLAPDTLFFGYIDLGVQSSSGPLQNLRQKEIASRVAAWRSLGARGILLDDYGYDYGVTRERQIEAVGHVHEAGLNVIANSWDPRHALDSDPGPANPKGLRSPLRRSDYYFYESYLVSEGEWVNYKAWRAKANTLGKLLRRQPVGILSCTTTTRSETDQERIEFAWACAWLEGHDGWGWGEPNFSASDNAAPYRARPKAPAPNRRSGIRPSGEFSVECLCDGGRVVADYANKLVRLEPRPSWLRRLFRLT